MADARHPSAEFAADAAAALNPDLDPGFLDAGRTDGRFGDCLSARATAAAVRAGDLRAEDAVGAAIARIRAVNGNLLAFSGVWADDALRRARDLDADPRRKDLPLAGVPFAVKDNTGLDDACIGKLTAAGAIPVGTTMTPQFCGWGTTDSQLGITGNPVLPGRTPGGSSGGSAAAVAAGLVPFAHGNDGMGSLRIPASCCHLATIKATPGTVPGTVGWNSWYGMSVHGVLAQDTRDLALLMDVLTDGGTGGVADAEVPPSPGLGDVKLDVSAAVAGVPVGKRWAEAARAAAKRLAASGGHEPVEAKAPYPTNPIPMLARWTAGVADSLERSSSHGRLEERNRVHARIGRRLRPTIKDSQLTEPIATMETFLPAEGVLITPALAAEPPAAGNWHKRSWARNMLANTRFTPFTSVWNLLGFPAGVAVEATTGLPVQVIARLSREDLVLTAMAAIEASD